jgi:hypothetical protein
MREGEVQEGCAGKEHLQGHRRGDLVARESTKDMAKIW